MPITILPEALVRHIAAGEVVERPASIVKELLENALDASSSRLVIELEQGGSALIRITDDGHGIRQLDVPNLLHRHATSKIASLDDLQAIATLGFRGEALYSIAAVTRFRILTRHREEEVGTELFKDDDQGLIVKPWAGPAGTTIEAKDLFYNLPVRRKFLKTPGAEYGRIADLVARYCLAYPSVAFEISHNGRRTLHAFGTGEADALIALFGGSLASEMVAVTWDVPGVAVTGYLAPPSAARTTRKDQTTFVNGRLVRDTGLNLAVERAYQGMLGDGRYPIFVIHATLPGEEVDVNVHPNKTEVRFADPRGVYRQVNAAVAQALAEAPWPLRGGVMGNAPFIEPIEWQAPVPRQLGLPVTQSEAGSADRLVRPMPEPTLRAPDNDPGSADRWVRPGPEPTLRAPEDYPGSADRLVRPDPEPTLRAPGLERQTVPGDLIHLPEGILALKLEGDLLLIDLPRLHARVLYEELASDSAPTSQPLLFPVPLDLTADLGGAFEEHRALLEGFGFGLTDQSITAAPIFLGGQDPARALTDILHETLDETRALPTPEMRQEALRRAAANRGAARPGRPLRDEELRWLLGHVNDLRYYTSLAGQPTIIRLTQGWFDRLFGRGGSSRGS